MSLVIERLTAESARAARGALVSLLQDAVDGGASLGFLPPLPDGEAGVYWESVARAVEGGSRVLVVAHAPDRRVAGAAQLDLATRANARHRAEVAKLMVHRAARRQGIGRALMLALEAEARREARGTLVLDTRQGDPSERLYGALGYVPVGAIPRYARNADGSLDATVIYYKLLG